MLSRWGCGEKVMCAHCWREWKSSHGHGGLFGHVYQNWNVCISFLLILLLGIYLTNIYTCSRRYRLQDDPCTVRTGEGPCSAMQTFRLVQSAYRLEWTSKGAMLWAGCCGQASWEALVVKAPGLWKAAQWTTHLCSLPWGSQAAVGDTKTSFSLYVILYHLMFVPSATLICKAVLKMWSKDPWVPQTHPRGIQCLLFSNYVSVQGWFSFTDFNQSNPSQQTGCKCSHGDPADYLRQALEVCKNGKTILLFPLNFFRFGK